MDDKKVYQTKETEAVDTYPGVAVDIADDENVTPDEVKEYVKTLNNNPRTSDD